MVNVLIIGATGYIGQALSQSLVRSGEHRVYGLARSESKAKSLSAQEIIPIIGSISDNANILKAIENEPIQIVVDVAGANQESHDLLTLLKKASADRLATFKKANVAVAKLGFVYGSGIWVHGSSNEPVNDLVPVGPLNTGRKAVAMMSWRPDVEQAVLGASDVLDTLVIRPAVVYGRAGAVWSSLFQPIYEAAQAGAKSVSIFAEPDSRPGLVHVDDVAAGYHAAIDKLQLVAGTGVYRVFDLQTSQESMRDILEAAGREFGFKGKIEIVGCGDDLLAQAMSTSVNSSSGRAKQILGWEPRRIGFVKSMEIFAKAWLAAK